MSHILHPELFDRIPLRGTAMRATMERRANEIAQVTTDKKDPNVSIVIRTKNDMAYLKVLFADIRTQDYKGTIEIIVVDTESTDGTVEFAVKRGANVIPIKQSDFSYPKALNLGFAAAKYPYVVSIVGHSSLCTDLFLKSLTRWYDAPNFGGLFSSPLVNWNASRSECWATAAWVPKFMKPGHLLIKSRGGLLAANSAIISHAAWKRFGGFDERYAAGGEDSALGNLMMQAGMQIAFEPISMVHHSHGLGPINNLKQLHHWSQLAKPLPFEEAKVLGRRPDLKKRA